MLNCQLGILRISKFKSQEYLHSFTQIPICPVIRFQFTSTFKPIPLQAGWKLKTPWYRGIVLGQQSIKLTTYSQSSLPTQQGENLSTQTSHCYCNACWYHGSRWKCLELKFIMACKLWYADVQTVDYQASFPSSHMAGMSLHSHPWSTGSCDYHVCGRNSHLEREACVGLQSNSYLNS